MIEKENVIIDSIKKSLILSYKGIKYKLSFSKKGDDPYKYNIKKYHSMFAVWSFYEWLRETECPEDWCEMDINADAWRRIKADGDNLTNVK